MFVIMSISTKMKAYRKHRMGMSTDSNCTVFEVHSSPWQRILAEIMLSKPPHSYGLASVFTGSSLTVVEFMTSAELS